MIHAVVGFGFTLRLQAARSNALRPSDHVMESNTNFTEDDEGKNVINQHGETIGRVVEVENNRAYVDPDPGVTDAIMSKLGWGSRDEGSYLLDADSVESITDDEVRLSSL